MAKNSRSLKHSGFEVSFLRCVVSYHSHCVLGCCRSVVYLGNQHATVGTLYFGYLEGVVYFGGVKVDGFGRGVEDGRGW